MFRPTRISHRWNSFSKDWDVISKSWDWFLYTFTISCLNIFLVQILQWSWITQSHLCQSKKHEQNGNIFVNIESHLRQFKCTITLEKLSHDKIQSNSSRLFLPHAKSWLKMLPMVKMVLVTAILFQTFQVNNHIWVLVIVCLAQTHVQRAQLVLRTWLLASNFNMVENETHEIRQYPGQKARSKLHQSHHKESSPLLDI